MNVVGGMNDWMPGGDALAEAERWFVHLRMSDCPDADRVAFERWRRVPANAAAFAQTQRFWDDIGGLAGDPALDRMAAEALAATAPQRRTAARRRWRVPVGLAAAAACALVAVAIRAPGPGPLLPPVVHATGPELRDTLVLADGSRVVLDVGTEIAVSMRDDAREISLRHGQALFDVAHDASRPFRVAAGGGEVIALGTRFQVSRAADRVEVTLLQGSVAVEHGQTGERVRLWPNEQAAYADSGGRIATRAVDPEVTSSWTRGRLLFRGTPLSDLVVQVNRYVDRPLRLDDPSLARIPVSGTFPIGDSQSVALGLQALLPIQADLGDEREIVLRRR